MQYYKMNTNKTKEIQRVYTEEELKEILESPDFFEVLDNELSKKLQGEDDNRKVCLLVMIGGTYTINCHPTSTNLMINGCSGGGKDYLANCIISLLPKQRKVVVQRLSATSLSYFIPENNDESWNNICLFVEDIENYVLNSPATKLFLTSTRDGAKHVITNNGHATTREIKGKPVFVVSTAEPHIQKQLRRRFTIIKVDESDEQTTAIKKRIAENDFSEYDEKILEAIKLLKPVSVIVPFAKVLQHFVGNGSPIVRTYFHKIIDYIKFSAAIHQYNRHETEVTEQKYIVADKQDYEITRQVLNKMISNNLMATPTNNQRDILSFLEKEKQSVSAKDISIQFDYSERYARDELKTLEDYGMLKSSAELGDEGRKVKKYSLRSFEKFYLPEFNDDWMRDDYEPNFLNGVEVINVSDYSLVTEENPDVRKAREEGII